MLNPTLDLDAFPDLPFPVATRRELRRKGLMSVEAMGRKLLILWNGGAPRVYVDACAHLGLPMSMGRLRGDRVACGYHGWEFATDDGRVLEQPTLHKPRRCSLDRCGSLVAGDLVFAWLGDPADEARVRARLPAQVLDGISLFRVTFECPFYLALFSSVDYAHFAFHRGYRPLYRVYKALRSNAHVPGSPFSSRVIAEDDRRLTVRIEEADRDLHLYASCAEMDDSSVSFFQTFVTPVTPTRTVYWECYRPRGRSRLLNLMARATFHTATVRLLDGEDKRWTGASTPAFLAGDNIHFCENDLPLTAHVRKFVLPALRAHRSS